MATSLDDILTAIQNGVRAINALSNTYANWYSFSKGALFARSAMATSLTTIYTVPASVQAVVQDIEICNTAGGSGSFTVYLVPSGGTPSAANALFSAQTLAGNTTFQWKGTQILGTGGTIRAFANASTMTIMISGAIG